MARRNRLDVDAFFTEVDQTQEVYNLRERLEKLEQELTQTVEREQQLVTEIEQLRSRSLSDPEQQQLQGQIETLREHLKQAQGTVHYPVAKIQRNPNQPRQTFIEEVESMALSLETEGQLDPVILFEDGMLFDGECRWRAAKQLGWETLEAVFTAPKDEKTLRRKAYLTSLHRRNLNTLDRAETLVAIACDEIPNLLPEDVPRVVNRVMTRLKRKKKSLGERLHLQRQDQQQFVLEQLGLETVEAQVLAVFLELQEHPASLNRNVFPTLNLAPELRTAVREKALGCPQALILNRLSAINLDVKEQKALELRKEGIDYVLTKNPSIAVLQQWVADQKNRLLQYTKAASRDQKVERMIAAVHKFDFSEVAPSPEQIQELRQALKSVLEELAQIES